MFAEATIAMVLTLSPVCNTDDKVVRYLTFEHEERITYEGLTNGGNLMRIWTSKHGTWTMTLAPPGKGVTCMVTGGDSWHRKAAVFDEPT